VILEKLGRKGDSNQQTYDLQQFEMGGFVAAISKFEAWEMLNGCDKFSASLLEFVIEITADRDSFSVDIEEKNARKEEILEKQQAFLQIQKNGLQEAGEIYDCDGLTLEKIIKCDMYIGDLKDTKGHIIGLTCGNKREDFNLIRGWFIMCMYKC
ncbi:hypothetical protein M8C21_022290, partial [Ambrosia artemisiifolia]